MLSYVLLIHNISLLNNNIKYEFFKDAELSMGRPRLVWGVEAMFRIVLFYGIKTL